MANRHAVLRRVLENTMLKHAVRPLRQVVVPALAGLALLIFGAELSGRFQAPSAAAADPAPGRAEVLRLYPHLGREIAEQGNAALREMRQEAVRVRMPELPAPDQATRNTRAATAS